MLLMTMKQSSLNVIIELKYLKTLVSESEIKNQQEFSPLNLFGSL